MDEPGREELGALIQSILHYSLHWGTPNLAGHYNHMAKHRVRTQSKSLLQPGTALCQSFGVSTSGQTGELWCRYQNKR